jgi:ABC-type oligopeptide transport system substrate-binding subunit
VRRRVLALVVIVALAAASAACTRDNKGSGKPKSGGVLRLGITADSSFDPAQARTVEQLLVADQLFDGLTAYDMKTHHTVPALAARWTVTEDQRQWDFFIKPGVTFSNGRPVTANDVKFTLDRVARKGSGSPGADLLEMVTGYGDTALKGTAPALAGVTAPAPDTVHISLDQAFSELPAVLSSPVFGIVPQEAVESAAPVFGKQPVTSGPFKFGSRVGTTIHLLRAAPTSARLAGIDLRVYDGAGASYNAFAAGELDWSQVPPEQVSAASTRYGTAGFVPYAAELLYGINVRNPKFADVRFREAILRAIDRRALVKAVYDDIYKPLNQVVVAGIPEFAEGACGDLCTHDVTKAKELVAAVYPGGAPEIFLDYDSGVIRDALAKAIQADLKEAGIPATLRPKEFDDYLNFEVSGQQELFLLGWIAAYPAAEAFLGPLFASGSRNNLIGFNVEAFDGALRAARAQADETSRVDLYREAERVALSQVPVIPILQYEVHSVIAKRVNALELSPTGTFDGSRVWLGSS